MARVDFLSKYTTVLRNVLKVAHIFYLGLILIQFLTNNNNLLSGNITQMSRVKYNNINKICLLEKMHAVRFFVGGVAFVIIILLHIKRMYRKVYKFLCNIDITENSFRKHCNHIKLFAELIFIDASIGKIVDIPIANHTVIISSVIDA